MSLKQKLRSLERKLTDEWQRWVTKLTDVRANVIWAPRPPREAERVREIHIGGVDIREI